jgi:hypothetical protein
MSFFNTKFHKYRDTKNVQDIAARLLKRSPVSLIDCRLSVIPRQLALGAPKPLPVSWQQHSDLVLLMVTHPLRYTVR